MHMGMGWAPHAINGQMQMQYPANNLGNTNGAGMGLHPTYPTMHDGSFGAPIAADSTNGSNSGAATTTLNAADTNNNAPINSGSVRDATALQASVKLAMQKRVRNSGGGDSGNSATGHGDASPHTGGGEKDRDRESKRAKHEQLSDDQKLLKDIKAKVGFWACVCVCSVCVQIKSC
jgi:hypothetical protein